MYTGAGGEYFWRSLENGDSEGWVCSATGNGTCEATDASANDGDVKFIVFRWLLYHGLALAYRRKGFTDIGAWFVCITHWT